MLKYPIIFAAMRVFIFAICLIMITTGCLEDPQCVEFDNDILEIEFLRADTTLAYDLQVNSLRIEEYDAFLLLDTVINAVYIPLDPSLERMELTFNTDQGTDTLVITYRYTPKLFAPQCEVVPLYSPIHLEKNTFDSLNFENLSLPPNASVYF